MFKKSSVRKREQNMQPLMSRVQGRCCFLSDCPLFVCIEWIVVFWNISSLSAAGGVGVGAVSQWGGDGALSVACVLFF